MEIEEKNDRLVVLRDEEPVGPVQAVRDVGRIRSKRQLTMRSAGRKSDFRHDRQERCLAGQMAVAAVGMYLDDTLALVRQVSSRVMLMRMVAEMLCRLLAFVLAICRHRCPRELERQ